MSYISGFESRPRKAEHKWVCNGLNVYVVGKYHVTVMEDGSLTYQTGNGNTDPKATLPNMQVTDGEIRIAIDDLLPLFLERMEPFEIAQALWQDEYVRSEFIDCLAERWNDQGITDADRRKFLHKIKASIHSKALDHLVDVVAKLEYGVAKQSFFWHEVNNINEYLREAGITGRDGKILQMRQDTKDREFDTGKRFWTEARDDWRKLLEERFKFEDIQDEPVADGGEEVA